MRIASMIMALVVMLLCACSNGKAVMDSSDRYQYDSVSGDVIAADNKSSSSQETIDDEALMAEAIFTDRAGKSAPTPLKIGDSFLGWKLVELSTWDMENPETGLFVKADFEGSIVIKGTLTLLIDDELHGDRLMFLEQNNEERSKLPIPISDYRDYNLFLGNVDYLIGILQECTSDRENLELGSKSWDNCEIRIPNFSIAFWPVAVYDSAELVEVISIPATEDVGITVDIQQIRH